MVPPGYMKLKVDTQSPGWHTKLTKVLKNIRGISYRIDVQEGVAHVNGRIDPKNLLKKLQKAGRVAELMEVHSADRYGTMYGHDYHHDVYFNDHPCYGHYGRSEPSYHRYPYYYKYKSRPSQYDYETYYYEPRYYGQLPARYPYYPYEPPAQCFPQPPSPVKVHPFYDPHYSCSIM